MFDVYGMIMETSILLKSHRRVVKGDISFLTKREALVANSK